MLNRIILNQELNLSCGKTKKVWNETKTCGLAIPVKSSYGHTYVAEEFNYDPQQKKLELFSSGYISVFLISLQITSYSIP